MPHDRHTPTLDIRDKIWSFRYSLLLMTGYAAVHLLLRIGLATSIGVDDAAEQVFAQTLSPGYDIKQPPLYPWLLWLVQRVTGPAMLSFLLLKYALLLTTFACCYRIARRLFGETRYAAFAAWSILLLYQIGWNSHEGVTQTQVLSASCAATLLFFLRAAERPSGGRYLALGAAIAAGFLSKLSFGAFLGCLTVAALWRPPYRGVLLSPRLLATVAAVLVLTGPYLWWLAHHSETLTGVYTETMVAGAATGTATRIGKGLLSILTGGLGFLVPLLPLLILLFPGAWRPGLPSAAPGGPVSGDLERLLCDMLLAAVGILIAGVLVAGVKHYKERWMHPFLLVAPLYFWARVRRSDPSPARLRAFVGIFLAIGVAVLGIRAARLIVGPPLCNYCLPKVPYGAFTDTLAAEGFRTGTIVTPSDYTAANMRAAFPTARVYAMKHPALPLPPVPAAPAPGRKCLFVWPTDFPWETFPAAALPYLGLPADAEATLAIKSVNVPWPRPWPLNWSLNWISLPARTSHWKYVLFDAPQGQCR